MTNGTCIVCDEMAKWKMSENETIAMVIEDRMSEIYRKSPICQKHIVTLLSYLDLEALDGALKGVI